MRATFMTLPSGRIPRAVSFPSSSQATVPTVPPAGGNDDVVALGYRIAGGGDRLFLRLGDDHVFTKPREVQFDGGPPPPPPRC